MSRIMTLALAAFPLCGCRTAAPSKFAQRETAQPQVAPVAQQHGALQEYVRNTPGLRNFQQLDLTRRNAGPRPYPRDATLDGRIEGSLAGRIEFPLQQYLDPHSRGLQRPRIDWPAGRSVEAFFLEFEPPILEWPDAMPDRDMVVAQANTKVFDRDGVPFATGTCRRRVRVGGFESVRAGDQHFEDAVRLESDTELSFGWMASVRIYETAWFAKDIGLVRRDERYSGRAMLVIRFHAHSRYEPAEPVQERAETVAQELSLSSRKAFDLDKAPHATPATAVTKHNLWSRLAICLERTGRHIRVSGLAVEYD